MAFPVTPDHAMPGGRMFAVKIHAIQVGAETVIEPPGSPNTHSTVARIVVIVTIFGGERRATMRAERITSSS